MFLSAGVVLVSTCARSSTMRRLFSAFSWRVSREGEVRLHGLDLADERIDEVLDAHDQLIAALLGEVHDARGALRHLRCMAGFVRVR